MATKDDLEELCKMVDECMEYPDSLTDWEREFVADIDAALARGRPVSLNQQAKLGEIWQKVQ